MKEAKLVLFLVLVLSASASFGMGSSPPSDELVFKGSDQTIKPSPTITQIVKVTSANQNVNPRCSKSGQIIFQSYVEQKRVDSQNNTTTVGNFNIFTSNGNVFKTVTNDYNNNEYPSFINDNKIIFNSSRLGTEKIWIADASGKGGTIQLTSGISNDWMPDVSPDGKKVIFCSFSKYYTETLGITDYGARWKIWNLISELPTIWMVDIDGRNLTQFYEGIKPTWSPDAKKIAYYKLTGDHYQIWVMDADGGNQTQITNGAYNCIEPSWTPDGGRVVFASNSAGNYDIWSQKIDGTELTQLTIQDSYDGSPCCSLDGKYIYFHSFMGGSWNIWKMELAKPFSPINTNSTESE
jgi:Tol biopolymer transport system component